MHIEGHTMTPEQAEPWLAALESGTLAQVRNFLTMVSSDRSGTRSYCCLGVFAKVAGAKFADEAGNDVVLIDGQNINASQVLDNDWASAHGLTTEMQDLLASCNDGTTAIRDRRNHPLFPLWELLADKTTPLDDDDGVRATFEVRKHTFAEIAKIIREHFVK